MKKILIPVLIILCGFCYAADNQFDDRGVWHALNGISLAESTKTTFGLINVSGWGEELNIMVYGTTPDDSLVYTIDIYGMMSPNLSDTTKSVKIYTSTNNLGAGAKSHADTLNGNEMFPYLWGQLYNIDGDSTLTVDVWFHVKQLSVSSLNN